MLVQALKFKEKGDKGYFENPEQNNGVVYSYPNAHKPALLGQLGAILGLDGRGQMRDHNGKIEYYEELKNIKVAIIPNKPKFETYIQEFNNSTGFANKNGACQQIRREVLQNVSWTIYLLCGSVPRKYLDKLISLISKNESIYPIYLGNKHMPAQFNNVELVDLEVVEDTCDIIGIDGLFKHDIVEEVFDQSYNDGIPFYYPQYLPVELNEMGKYKEMVKMCHTNLELEVKEGVDNLYKHDNRVLYFF